MLARWTASIALALTLPLTTLADDIRLQQLESEVTRLRREVEEQARRIDQLERSAREATLSQSTPGQPRRSDDSPAWLVTTNWDRIRPGMKELDVIALLGRPTSVRIDAAGKVHTFLYALELGPKAFLSGNVRLDDSGVVDVAKPTLR